MKLLFFCSKYNHQDSSPWLISELAEFLSCNHDVSVVCLDWSSPLKKNIFRHSASGSLQVFFLPTLSFKFLPKSFSLFIKWFFSSLITPVYILHLFFKKGRFDISISISPCAALWAGLPFLKICSKRIKLIYWDFFPIHNFQIRSAPDFILPPLKMLEQTLVNLFDVVGCMSPACVEFFHSYFSSVNNAKPFVLPIWSSIDVRALPVGKYRNHFSSQKINFIFGGQLTHGRDLLNLCQQFVEASSSNPDIVLNLCGSGPLLDYVQSMSSKHSAINYLGQFSRSEYLSLLNHCDVGVISLVSEGSAPAYPSKSLDYMASSLPILAFTDMVSDFSSIVNQNRLGISVTSSSISLRSRVILRLAHSREFRRTLGLNALEFFIDNHTTASAAHQILN